MDRIMRRILLGQELRQHKTVGCFLLLFAVIGAAGGFMVPSGLFGLSPLTLAPHMDSYLRSLHYEKIRPAEEFLDFFSWNGGAALAMLIGGLYKAGPILSCSVLLVRSFSFAIVDFYLICAKGSCGPALFVSVLIPQLLSLLVCMRIGTVALPASGLGRDGKYTDERERIVKLLRTLTVCLPDLILAALLQACLTRLVLRLAWG